MTIPADRQALIHRLYHGEKWRVGTIARELGLHHSTVTRVLTAGAEAVVRIQRPSLIDPFVPFVLATLERFPRLPASRLHAMVRERGYTGSASHFRHQVARLRPRPAAEAYLRLQTLPGEQAQVDWAHFGEIAIGRARRRLLAFVMVLSWSRQLFVRFFVDQRMASFLRGHVEAFGPSAACRGWLSTTTSSRWCSSARARRCASTRRSPPWPATTASSRDRRRRRGATRRDASSGRSATCAPR